MTEQLELLPCKKYYNINECDSLKKRFCVRKHNRFMSQIYKMKHFPVILQIEVNYFQLKSIFLSVFHSVFTCDIFSPANEGAKCCVQVLWIKMEKRGAGFRHILVWLSLSNTLIQRHFNKYWPWKQTFMVFLLLRGWTSTWLTFPLVHRKIF